MHADVAAAVAKHAELKCKHPELSAVFVLPQSNAAYMTRMAYMQTLDGVSWDRRDDHLHPGFWGRSWLQNKRSWHIKYSPTDDPANQKVLTSCWGVSLSGIPGRALLDTGAQASFVSEDYAHRHGLHISPASGSVTLPDGSTSAIAGTCSV